MCGITGIWNINGRPVDRAMLETMTTLLYHRGPDDHGYVFFDTHGKPLHHGRQLPSETLHSPLAMGHRRLTIIDLEATGRQPMSDADEKIWITYNGEIYNYIELKDQLCRLGYRFVGTSDTEVILKAYLHWGVDCVKHFNGMWAFAIWDSREQKLFCSRDRFGIKPFYFYYDEQRFVFASEIKSVLAALDNHQHSINEPYLARFIITSLLNDCDQTLFANVNQLRPACCMEIKNRHIKQWRYWDIPDSAVAQADTGHIDENEAAERLRELLSQAVKLRFRADVPVGTCLSGGLDSSAVTALAADAFNTPVLSFTTEYLEKEYSEGHFARAAAQACHTDASYTNPQPEDYLDFIEQFSWFHDEPCPGPGPFSQWHVMKLARQRVKVVLDGQGADELLAGYHHYFNYYLTSLFKRVFSSNPNRPTFSQYLHEIKRIAQHTGVSALQSHLTAIAHVANRTLPESIRWPVRQFRRFSQRHTANENAWTITDPQLLRCALPGYQHRPRKFRDDLNEILYWELTRDNIPMLLQYGDRTSMAFSIESRVPFLDVHLVEYISSLPYHLKINGAATKVLLRKAVQHRLPDMVVNRADKKAYPTPFSLWLKGPLKDYVQDVFHSQSFKNRGVFHPQKTQNLMIQHVNNIHDHDWLIWRIVNIEIWMRLFRDRFTNQCRDRIQSIHENTLSTSEQLIKKDYVQTVLK